MGSKPTVARFPRLQEEITLQIPPRDIKRLDDPYEEGRFSYEAQVPVSEAAKLLIGNANPRQQNTASSIPKEIRESLDRTPKTFHLKNRGIWIAAKKAEYDNQKGVLNLFCPQGNDDKYGAVDGGHTLAVIQEFLAETSEESSKETDAGNTKRSNHVPYVMLHIRVGVEGDLTDMAACLNRSAQLKEYTLANYRDEFHELKELLDKENFGDQIDYRENGDGQYDVLDAVQRLTLFCNGLFPASKAKHPVVAYSSKAKCLELFLSNKQEYLALAPIVGDCFRLPDQVERILPKVSGSGRFGGYGFVKTLKKPRLAASLRGYPENPVIKAWATEHDVVGITFPITAGLRVLVHRKADGTVLGWREDPIKFFLKHGRDLFEPVTGFDYENPNALGKNHELWSAVYLSAYQALHPEA